MIRLIVRYSTPALHFQIVCCLMLKASQKRPSNLSAETNSSRLMAAKAWDSKHSNLCLYAILLLTLLTMGCGTTYPGAIEQTRSEATNKFESEDEAKKYIEGLEKQALMFSSSDPDLNIRKVTFSSVSQTVYMHIEYEVSKTAKVGEHSITISGKDVSGKELSSTTLKIEVAGNKPLAMASVGMYCLLGGALAIGFAYLNEDSPGSSIIAIGGALGMIAGIFMLLWAMLVALGVMQ